MNYFFLIDVFVDWPCVTFFKYEQVFIKKSLLLLKVLQSHTQLVVFTN